MANNEEGVEPMHKKQKCGEVSPSASPSFGGGPMYDEATARKMLKEAVLVPAYTLPGTRNGEAVIGFDPNDEALDNEYEAWHHSNERKDKITPMIHFARKGDAKMCRYLISRGASTTKCPVDGLFPMSAAAEAGKVDICTLLYANGAKNDVNRNDEDGATPMHAAAREGHLEVCKFLHANGASHDIWKSADGWTPLAYAALNENHEIVRWLVLEGALCIDDGSEIREGGRFYPKSEWSLNVYFERLDRSRERLVEWAEEVTQTHASIITFLHGTRPPPSGTDGRSNLECLSVHPGIRKHICDFVGQEVTKKRHLHILRQLKTALPCRRL